MWWLAIINLASEKRSGKFGECITSNPQNLSIVFLFSVSQKAVIFIPWVLHAFATASASLTAATIIIGGPSFFKGSIHYNFNLLSIRNQYIHIT